MMKVLLKDYGKIFQIGNRQLQGGTLQELTDAEVKKHPDIIQAEIKKTSTKELPKPTKLVEKKYTEKEFFAWNKDKQVKELTKLGIKPASREADRVNQLLEAQK